MVLGYRKVTTSPRHWLRWPLAVLAALVVPLAVARADPQSVHGTWAAEWPVVAGQVKPSGTLSGLQLAPEAGLVLAVGLESGCFESVVHDMGHEFLAVGAAWQAQVPPGAGIGLEVRRSCDGVAWGPWEALIPDDSTGPDKAPPGLHYSELVFGRGRYLQVRATLRQGTGGAVPSLSSLKLVAIDPGTGPQVATVAGATPPAIISRAAWGANEAWMTWPPEYAPVTHFVIHHTTGSNDIPDPAAFVRAIYYFHAVTRGWGDIGYNYLIDREGRIYEGRAGGDGVIGAHAAPYNRGTVGVAILGDYSTSDVPAAALSALVELLAWKGNLHFVHPLESRWLLDRTFPTIMGHRDCNNTPCPGDRAYALLPQIRARVFERMRAIPPRVILSRPARDETVSGVYRVTWQVSAGVSQVSLAVDGQVRRTFVPGAPYGPWDTTVEADGYHRLQLTASTDLGESSSVEIPLQVDNTPPSGSLTAPLFTRDAGVSLSLACTDCTDMQFGAGWRWEGEDLFHAPGTGQVVADAAAANGRAWLGRAGDSPGPWYGPYFCGLPYPGDYEAVFWLRSGQSGSEVTVAELDVADQAGTRILAGPWPLGASDFAAGRYQPFRLRFRYPDRGSSCQGGGNDGLELRTWFKAAADLWLDRVEILTAPQPFAAAYWFALPRAEGRYLVEVRFLDRLGNVSPVYSQTVTVDHTAPVFGPPSPSGVPVEDPLAGLDAASAAFSLSDNAMDWGDWRPASLVLSDGGTSGTIAAQPDWIGNCVRLRVQDRAGNVAYSAPTVWHPAGPQPTPDPSLPPTAFRWRTYGPLAQR